jgi:tRNA (cmo5U34)-methyltransferase
LNNIYKGLLPGGILIISEKISFTDPQQQTLQTEMHHIFKKANGYSDLEISQKRTALENVLIPETFKQHQQRLLNAGFNSAEVWFQYFNFASILALK